MKVAVETKFNIGDRVRTTDDYEHNGNKTVTIDGINVDVVIIGETYEEFVEYFCVMPDGTRHGFFEDGLEVIE